jgi:hypothetical protein
VKVAGKPSDTQKYACVLHASVWIEELCPYRTDLRPERMRNHLFEPPRRDHVHIVVQKNDDLASRLPHGMIVDGKVIEAAGMPYDPNTGILPQA